MGKRKSLTTTVPSTLSSFSVRRSQEDGRPSRFLRYSALVSVQTLGPKSRGGRKVEGKQRSSSRRPSGFLRCFDPWKAKSSSHPSLSSELEAVGASSTSEVLGCEDFKGRKES